MTLSNLQTIEISVSDKKLDNLRILHLSDLHINKKTTIEKLNELDAEAFEWFKKLRKFIKETKEVTKS